MDGGYQHLILLLLTGTITVFFWGEHQNNSTVIVCFDSVGPGLAQSFNVATPLSSNFSFSFNTGIFITQRRYQSCCLTCSIIAFI